MREGKNKSVTSGSMLVEPKLGYRSAMEICILKSKSKPTVNASTGQMNGKIWIKKKRIKIEQGCDNCDKVMNEFNLKREIKRKQLHLQTNRNYCSSRRVIASRAQTSFIGQTEAALRYKKAMAIHWKLLVSLWTLKNQHEGKYKNHSNSNFQFKLNLIDD